MDNNEVIAKLSKDNLELKEQVKDFRLVCHTILNKIYAISAPLNDNILKYNNRQLKIFHDIAEEIKSIL